MAKVDLRHHGGPLALIAVVVAGLALRGSPPPDKPCDGTWVWKSIEEESGCTRDLESRWVCEGASHSRVEPLPLNFERNAGQAPGRVSVSLIALAFPEYLARRWRCRPHSARSGRPVFEAATAPWKERRTASKPECCRRQPVRSGSGPGPR